MQSFTARNLRSQTFHARFKHTVRVILTQNVGEHQAGEVLHVSAGHAGNLLIPKKMALYAIAENFDRLGRKDPDIETAEERRERLEQMAADEANVELIAANVLQKYLRNKVVSAN
jgi:ribosomal protein L9